MKVLASLCSSSLALRTIVNRITIILNTSYPSILLSEGEDVVEGMVFEWCINKLSVQVNPTNYWFFFKTKVDVRSTKLVELINSNSVNVIRAKYKKYVCCLTLSDRYRYMVRVQPSIDVISTLSSTLCKYLNDSQQLLQFVPLFTFCIFLLRNFCLVCQEKRCLQGINIFQYVFY